jgi:Flp pilus assembly protein TadG
MQRLRRDDGAVAVLVAVCMVALLAVGAFVLDVGRIYAERRQLQNGADAATLAVVMDCHLPAGCAATAGTKAADKANQNANDGASTVASPVRSRRLR